MLRDSGIASQEQLERFERYLKCNKFECEVSCTCCDKTSYVKKERCGLRFMCGACCLVFARKIEDWLKDNWDDEDEFVSALAERLILRGFEALTATSGEEALWKVDASPVDVVLLDVVKVLPCCSSPGC